MTPNIALEKKLNKWAYVVSAAVLLLVGLMRQYKFDLGVDFRFLPPFHASLNAVTAIILLIAFWHIKNGRVEQHRKAIYLAMATSALFLLSYVLYHFTTPETKYGGEGTMRMIYFFLLITHVILAAVILPFVLFTFTRAYTNQFERHKKMARWVFPLWLYVAITGPICYLMLKPYY
ncbi:MAG TPA: DUF420 domain-containing protein [Saprospirales bacterium]|nr:DUF420 domain-containing protein [Saprospirales bacterium]